MIDKLPEWCLNVLEVYSLKNRSLPYTYWYDFLRYKLDNIDGDVLEFGVFRGRTLCTTAFCLSKLTVPRHVYGFDSFSGFPPALHDNDDPSKFALLRDSKQISNRHYEMVMLNLELLSVCRRSASTNTASSSGNFSATSVDFVSNKLDYLGLSNVTLVEGDIVDTLASNIPSKISAIFLDADLYVPYNIVLDLCWNNISPGGIVYLDEYYSLKFPGPRIAVDEFVAKTPNATLICIESPVCEFERWILQKTS